MGRTEADRLNGKKYVLDRGDLDAYMEAHKVEPAEPVVSEAARRKQERAA